MESLCLFGGVRLRLSLLLRRTGEARVGEGRARLRGEGDLGEGGSMKTVVVCREPARVSRSRGGGS